VANASSVSARRCRSAKKLLPAAVSALEAFAFSELNRLMRASTTNGKLDGVRLDSLIAVVDGARPSN
jgi:hypothetical protein